ncbi:MAG: hypothetical protein V4682_01025 [Patescibacteria group bacterium]
MTDSPDGGPMQGPVSHAPKGVNAASQSQAAVTHTDVPRTLGAYHEGFELPPVEKQGE